LQERVPQFVPVIRPRPAESTRAEPTVDAVAPRRFRSAHTLYPSAHFLSNGQYTAVVTNGGGGASSWRGLAVTRQRDDPTTGPRQPVRVPARREERTAVVGGPPARVPRSRALPVTFDADEAVFERTDDGIDTRLEVIVSPEDDVEIRRVTLVNRSDRLREIEVTSLVEIVLASPPTTLAPGVPQVVPRDRVPSRVHGAAVRPAAALARRAAPWAVHVISTEDGVHGAIEWETDRARFIGRGRTPENPRALDGSPSRARTGRCSIRC
jgi:cyclic beta-1,2-glucan synthetase